MRKLSKKISMLMVLAMLVSLFSGVVSASAASVWSFYNKTADDSIVAYAKETYKMENDQFADFDLYKSDEIVDTDVYTVVYESSDEDVVWVNARNGKLRAQKDAEIGATAKITAHITNKLTGKEADRSFTIEIVAAEVEEPAEVEYVIAPNFGEEAFVVGEEYELAAVVTADGEEIEADIVFSIDDEEVEVYAPAEAGEVTIVATVVIDGEEYAAEFTCEVIEVVATEIVEVKQKDAKTVEIIFDAKISAEEAAKIELFQGAVAKNVYKKDAVAKDNVVTFTSYKDFADKTEWIFKYGESEYKFTASYGAVDYVIIDGPSILYTEPVKDEDKTLDLKVSFYDANGVKVNPSGKDWIEWKYDSNLIYVYGDINNGYKISGKKADDVASLTGIYHSNDFKAAANGQYEEYKYDIAPVDIKILKSNAANIKAIASAKVGTAADKLIDKLPANRYDDYKLYVSFVMSDGTTGKAWEAGFEKVSYESTDESKLIVNPTTGAVIPLVANTSVEVIVNNDKDMIGVVTVVIGDNVKASDPSYTTYKTISNSEKLTDVAEFKFEGKDNYGADATYAIESIKTLSMPGTSAEADLKGLVEGDGKKVTANGNVITVNPRGLKTGNYVFETVVKSTVKDDNQKWTKTFSVFVEDADGKYEIKSVKLVAAKNEYDTTITEKTEALGGAITYKVIGYNEKGVAVEEIAVSECSITVKLNGAGDPVTNLNLYQAAADGKIVVSGTAYKAIANGAYVIEGKYNNGTADGIKFDSVTVNVKGAQAAPSIGFDKNEVTLTKGNTTEEALKAAIISTNCFSVPKATDKVEYTNLTVGKVLTSLADDSNAGTYVARVQNVTVTQKFIGSGIEVTFDVAVNKNITITVK